MIQETRTGRCLCGAVRFQADVSLGIGACHCTECQRWSGGGPLFVVPAENVETDGAEHIQSYRHSTWGERAFCTICGASLYWKMQGQPIASLAVGLLDDQTGMHVKEEIFVDTRPGWMPCWPDATQSTEAEEMAKLDEFLKEPLQ